MSFKTRQLCLLTTALVTIPAAAFMTTPAYADCVSGAGNTVLCSVTDDTNGFTGGDGLTLTINGVTVSNPTGNAIDLGVNSTVIIQNFGGINQVAGTGVPIKARSLNLTNNGGSNIIGSFAGGGAGTAIQINSLAGDVSTISNSGSIGGVGQPAISDGAGDITVSINDNNGTISGGLSLGAGHNVVILNGGTGPGNITADATGNNQLFLGGTLFGMLTGSVTNFQTLTKNGTSEWDLLQANNFSGGITVIQGALTGRSSVLNGTGSGNNIDVQAGGTVTFGDVSYLGSGTYNGIISGAGNVTVNNDTLTAFSNETSTTFTGANSYTGGTTILKGTLIVTNVGATTALALPGDVTNNGTLDFDLVNGATFTGIISGTGNIVKDGAGVNNITSVLVLSGINTYTGATTINAGDLSISASNNLGASSGIIFGGGTLQTTGSGFTVTQNMSGTSSAQVDTVNSGNITTASGIISTAGLTKIGAGTLVLAGVNTYTGSTMINGGILSVSAANNLGANSGITFGGGWLQTTGAGFTVTQDMSGTADALIEINGAGNTTTASGIISTTGLNKIGEGTLVLSGANTFSFLNITIGPVSSGAANGIPDTAVVSISGAGTLNLTGNETIGSLDGTGSTILNGNNLTTGDATNTTFSGIISDGSASGTLTTAGTGNFTLTGANIYTGLTTVNGGGTLTLNNAGGNTLASGNSITVNTGTLSVLTNQTANVVDSAVGSTTSVGTGATLTVGSLGGNSSFSGVVSGAGTVVKSGAGSVDFGAANTVSTITVNAGTANLNATNTVANINVNGGALNLTVANAISNTAVVTVDGGSLNLNSGNETIGSLAGTGGTIALGANTLTDASVNANPTTYAGVIAGTGGLTKAGAGKLALSGANTYTGLTMVSAGELEVTSTGSTTSSAFVAAGADLRVNGTVIGAVVNNGTLNGSGTIIGNITNNATYSPGNSPGIVTVTGNYTQAANSTLAVDIHAGATPATPVAGTDYDQVNVSGTASLAGTIAATVQPGHYVPGATYNLMTAGLGFGGTNFTTVIGLPTQGFISFTPSIVNGAGAAQTYVWTVSRLAYATAATTPNQIATANAFQSAIAGGVANPASDMASVLFALDGSTRVQAAALFSSAEPAYYGSVATANQDLGATFLRNVTARAHDSKGGGWATGYYHWGKGGGNDNAAGANIHNDGVAGGIDYTVAPNVLAGIAVGYGHSTIDGRDNLASGNSKGWQAGLYLAFNAAGFDLTGAVAYQKTNADATRMITGPVGFNRIATGHPDGKNYLASLEGSYKASLENMNLRPFVGVIYNKAKIDSFSESGANALDLNIQGFDPSSTRLYGGIEIKGNIASGRSATISPYARASYSHELSGNHRDIWSSFAGGGSSFMVTGREVSKGQVDLAAGLEANVAANITLFVGYDGQLRSDQKYHGVNGGFRVSF